MGHNGYPLCGISVEDSLSPTAGLVIPAGWCGAYGTVSASGHDLLQISLDDQPSGGAKGVLLCTPHQGCPWTRPASPMFRSLLPCLAPRHNGPMNSPASAPFPILGVDTSSHAGSLALHGNTLPRRTIARRHRPPSRPDPSSPRPKPPAGPRGLRPATSDSWQSARRTGKLHRAAGRARLRQNLRLPDRNTTRRRRHLRHHRRKRPGRCDAGMGP